MMLVWGKGEYDFNRSGGLFRKETAEACVGKAELYWCRTEDVGTRNAYNQARFRVS